MAKRKRGRPPLPKAERKRGVLGFRARDDLRRRLTDAAKLSGRSASEEIEHRLDQSFEMAELIAGAFRAALGETNGDLMRAIATVIWLIERRTGKKWNEDLLTAFEVSSAIDSIVRGLTQPLSPERAFIHFRRRPSSYKEGGPAELTEVGRRMEMGKGIALEALQKMGMAPSDAEIAEASKKTPSELSEAVYGKIEKK